MPYLSLSALLNPENDNISNPSLDYHPANVFGKRSDDRLAEQVRYLFNLTGTRF